MKGFPIFYQHFRKLLEDAFIEELVNPEELEKVKVKNLYNEINTTFPGRMSGEG